MNIAIIGLGVIGGSIAIGLKQQAYNNKITAYDYNPETIKIALQSGWIDFGANNIQQAIFHSDIIVIATTPGSYFEVLYEVAKHLTKNQILTDVNSTKTSVINLAQTILGDFLTNFVPSHPLVGSEISGLKGATNNLFENQTVILTPLEKTTKLDAIDKTIQLWKHLGANTTIMTANKHDQILAFTSHLPHVLSFAFLDTIVNFANKDELLLYTAGSFADFTRIAQSNPIMWRDICLANKDNILIAIKEFQKGLGIFKQIIQNENKEKIDEIFTKARSIKKPSTT